MNEKISVIMSVYKENENQLKNSIESIINQTYKNIEFIIIIDYPKEKWRIDFINTYNDDRIKIIVNKENMGLVKSLNRALEYVTGNYIARMDADDISNLDRLEKQLKYLKENNIDLCGGYIKFVDNNYEKCVYYPCLDKNILKAFSYTNPIPHPTWFGKREVFEKNNGYRNILTCEDYDFLLRAKNSGFKLSNYPEVLLNYSISSDGISRSNLGKQDAIVEYVRKNFKKNHIVSEKELEEYMNSKEFFSKTKRYNKYFNIRNKRGKYRNSNKFIFIIYTFLLVINFRKFITEINSKIYNKYLLLKDKKETEKCMKF